MILYSTFSAAHLAGLVDSEYDLGAPASCRLLRRGFNDHYVVTAGDQRYMLRVYLHTKYWIAGEGDIRFELDLLHHLRADGLGVSYPLPRRNRDTLGAITAPEGVRYYALFTYAPGAPLDTYDALHSRALGEALARIHRASDRFMTAQPRYSLDLSMLVDKPLERVRPFLEERRPEDWQYLCSVAAQLHERIDNAAFPADGWGYIHADMHGGNNFFTQDGAVTVFDFDHGGFGWRAYDLAAFLRDSEPENREGFLAGYESVRPLSEVERSVLPAFIKARTIWDDGDIAAMVDVWGTAVAERAAAGLVKSLRELE